MRRDSRRRRRGESSSRLGASGERVPVWRHRLAFVRSDRMTLPRTSAEMTLLVLAATAPLGRPLLGLSPLAILFSFGSLSSPPVLSQVPLLLWSSSLACLSTGSFLLSPVFPLVALSSLSPTFPLVPLLHFSCYFLGPPFFSWLVSPSPSSHIFFSNIPFPFAYYISVLELSRFLFA